MFGNLRVVGSNKEVIDRLSLKSRFVAALKDCLPLSKGKQLVGKTGTLQTGGKNTSDHGSIFRNKLLKKKRKSYETIMVPFELALLLVGILLLIYLVIVLIWPECF